MASLPGKLLKRSDLASYRRLLQYTRPYLGRLADTLIREHAWVYANPIYVGAPPR